MCIKWCKQNVFRNKSGFYFWELPSLLEWIKTDGVRVIYFWCSPDCKWNNIKEISWAHWLLISHFLGEHSLAQLLLLTTGLLYMEYSVAQSFLRFTILIIYGFVFFQPSTLALALLSHELVYVSNNWFMATHYLQHEGKVWFVRL